MKQFIFSLCLLFCISCTKEEEKPASIKVKTDAIAFIEVRTPIDGITLWNNKTDTIYANDENEFLFTKNIKIPEFVSIQIGDQRLKSILLPGKDVTITSLDSAYVFEGTNKAGMQFFNDVDRPYFSMTESNKFRNDTTAVQIEEKIKPLKAAELEKLQTLVEAKEIDADFETILKQEINYFYALRISQIVTVKQYAKTPIADDLIALLEKTVQEYPLTTTYKTSTWNKYAETVLREKALYEVLTSGTITKDTLQNYYLKDKLHPFYYNLISSYKDKAVAEKASANYIIGEAKQTKFEKSLISVYEQFQIDFPNSPYESYLAPDIQKIRDYHEKISGNMPTNVKFYENENVASLNDLIADLKGEKYYIDLWATWCSPCKREFKHNDVLNALLKEKGYKKLYISLDKPEQRTKWEQDIKYFELGGLHLLASKEFFADFEANHSLANGYITIPQYLIIDKKGNLVTNDAPRPSQIEKLRAFLEK
ncbi:redoxin family protein [uncultured Kordia sp.]|uniref:TlpA family protein disulfide reductase n=1 Tax=uncultured Kordia sp. TaxID=507699 RepID=UPI00260BA3ED|nr:redoxin family protein [uncultured Kordia sp.]